MTARCRSCGHALPAQGEAAGVCASCAFALAVSDAHPSGAAVPDAATSESGQSCGPYRLLHKIGEGGMGEVWEAEQREPVRRRVAVKLIKPGMDSKQVIARFEAERQALAMMDHPNVAKIFDAGCTSDGKPYFVMEYVRGTAINVHCDALALTTRSRIELFLRVCDGVQHAHQKTIIHRDLKPGNVLVAEHDGVALPKIIDFGVAKATSDRLTERSLYTEVGTLIGTPEYMSPEQAELTALDVDTRTDVYALGMMLYELLVGALPFDPKALREASFDELRRIIREERPQRPSTRLGKLGERESHESAHNRSTDVPTLRRQLSKELDWITLKALEKDRDRRYGSVSELAADLRRHLRHEPVLAGPPSTAYQARKFIERHRIGVAAAALTMIALAGFAALMAVQSARIARESRTKQRVAQFLTELFEVSSPSEARGRTITARELLDQSVPKIRTELADEPLVRIELMTTMGLVYRNLGLYAQSEPLLKEAFDASKSLRGADEPATLRLASEIGRLYFLQERNTEAEALLVPTLAVQRLKVGAQHPDTLETTHNLAYAHWGQNQYAKAEVLFREAFDARTRVLGPEHPDTLRSMMALGLTLRGLQRFDEAETLLVRALDVRRRLFGPDHPTTLNAMVNLSFLYADQGRTKESEALTRESYEGFKRVLGPKHPDTLGSLANLAEIAAAHGNRAEALLRLGEAVQSGFRFPDYIRDEPVFSFLHGDPEFERIVSLARENDQRLRAANLK